MIDYCHNLKLYHESKSRKYRRREKNSYIISVLVIVAFFSGASYFRRFKRHDTSMKFDPRDAKEIMDKIYKDLPDAFNFENRTENHQQRKAVKNTGGSPVYGEMKFEAVKELISHFDANENDVFVDLGSGSGKAPIEFALLTGGNAFGIEMAKFRHDIAIQAYDELPEVLKKKLTFVEGDMFKTDIPKATIFMVAGMLFSKMYPEIVELMMKYGSKEFRVWSIGKKDLPFPKGTILKEEMLEFEASWTKHQKTRLYWVKNPSYSDLKLPSFEG